MAKKISDKQSKLNNLIQYWRWQFLRLWKDYQRDYDHWKMISIKRLTIPDGDVLEENFDKRSGKIETIPHRKAEYEKIICIKYGINKPYDYRKKEISGTFKIHGEGKETDFTVRISLAKDFNDKIEEIIIENSNILIPKTISIVINLNAKIPDIKKEVERIVKEKQKKRKKYFNLKRGYERTIEIYKNYLEVYLLRTVRKLPNIEVARKIYPGECKTDTRNPENKVNIAFKQAKKLIEGGYRRII